MYRAEDIETLPVETVPDDGAVSVVSEPVEDTALEPVVGVVDVEGLRGDIDALGDKVVSLESGIRALTSDDAADTDACAVVVLDSSQWQEVREAWGWCKPGISLMLYLAMVVTLLVAALLGTRLWSAFTKGWRS